MKKLLERRQRDRRRPQVDVRNFVSAFFVGFFIMGFAVTDLWQLHKLSTDTDLTWLGIGASVILGRSIWESGVKVPPH